MSPLTDLWLQDIDTYRQQIYVDSPVCRAYRGLMATARGIQATFKRELPDYRIGNLSPGYLDYTYFSFSADDLRAKGLRYGIVLNHQTLAFELWLMAQNRDLQVTYWAHLKALPWNRAKTEMPQYTVLDTVLEAEPDFSNCQALATKLLTAALQEVEAINQYL